MTPEIKYALNGDVSIAYQILGNGPVDIIYVPPFVSNLELQWQEPAQARYLQRLASFSRLVMFDKRGTGLSDRSGIATLEERMDDLRAVMDAVGLERAVVFGTSEGGAMSLLFAATYPARVQALILYGAYARIVSAPDYPEGLSPEFAKDRMEDIRRRWGQAVTASFMAPERATDATFMEGWGRWERLSASPGAGVALYQMICELDVRHLLPAVRVPTLILHREGDPTGHASRSRFLGRHIPGARMVELPGNEFLPWFGDQDAILGEIEEFLTGTRSAPDVDRVLATVLFTDIVDATRMAVESGDEKWRELLENHHALIREELKRFRGREVDTAGDGFLAAFDGPARAIRAAVAIVHKLLQRGIRVRAGIHTGECDVMDNKLSGITVHTGARVASMAGPGEVLVSSTVKDLVAGSGLRFGDRGVHDLKGIPGRWQLYSVDIDG